MATRRKASAAAKIETPADRLRQWARETHDRARGAEESLLAIDALAVLSALEVAEAEFVRVRAVVRAAERYARLVAMDEEASDRLVDQYGAEEQAQIQLLAATAKLTPRPGPKDTTAGAEETKG